MKKLIYIGIDREDTVEYHLLVRAGNPECGTTRGQGNVDEGTQERVNMTYAHVFIKAIDVNDMAPQFVNLKASYTVNTTSLQKVVKVEAVDKDLGDGGKVKYINYEK